MKTAGFEARSIRMVSERVEKCFKNSPYQLTSLFNQAFKLSRTHFSDAIYFSVPGMVHFDTSFCTATHPNRFPSISVTGEKCHLNCEHCGRKILKNMIPATTPKKLLELCAKIKKEGGKGCLISGGSLKDGTVPLKNFIPAIKRVKHELGLDVVVHTGIVNPELAEALAEARIDGAMIDIIGSNETIRSVYHPNLTVTNFDHSLTLLEKEGIPIVPHVVVGLHYGKLKGEKRALQIISKHKPTALVIVALNPLEKTPMAQVKPPSPINVARVILAAKFMMPNIPIMLGCIRPGGKHKSKTDVLAIRGGVNGIAYPSEEGYNFAKKIGLQIKFSEECCALTYKDLITQISPPTTKKRV
ncbi:radical SAM protein [Candidatus Bathyarchaeota archaeon]|nr:radical SAM protein [Candidatus Bathyarchaeota archaeon]